MKKIFQVLLCACTLSFAMPVAAVAADAPKPSLSTAEAAVRRVQQRRLRRRRLRRRLRRLRRRVRVLQRRVARVRHRLGPRKK